MHYGKGKSSRREFDRSLDVELWSAKTPVGELPRRNILVVQVFSYDRGLPKVQVSRETEDGVSLKMGRLSAAEVRLAVPLLLQAADVIRDKYKDQELKNAPLWDSEDMGGGGAV